MTSRASRQLSAAEPGRQRVLVTGGANGIGKAIVDRFVAAGHQVAVCDSSATDLERMAGDGSIAAGYHADIADAGAVERMFRQIADEFGGIDILVNNAGISGPTAPVEDISLRDWEATFSVNMTGTFLCTRFAAPLMKKNGSGSIVSISSAAGRFGFAMRTPYSASKWAVVGFTKSIAMELGPFGIRANAVLPGIVAGDRLKRVVKAKAEVLKIPETEMEKRMVENVSMRSTVSADDVASLVLFLCSPEGARISGQALAVDGNLEVLR